MSETPADESHPLSTGIPAGDMFKYAESFEEFPYEFSKLDPFEYVVLKSLFSGAAGAAMGLVFGMFTSGMDNPVHDDPHYMNKSTREQIRQSFKQMKRKCKTHAKMFGSIGLLYSACEFLVSDYTASHEVMNAGAAGCLAGGLLAYQGGPMAIGSGCIGFAAFSLAIDSYMFGKTDHWMEQITGDEPLEHLNSFRTRRCASRGGFSFRNEHGFVSDSSDSRYGYTSDVEDGEYYMDLPEEMNNENISDIETMWDEFMD